MKGSRPAYHSSALIQRQHNLCNLLHMDVCGPMPEESFGGARYFATWIDDYELEQGVVIQDQGGSRCRRYLTSLQLWNRCLASSERQVRLDNGGEYGGNALLRLLQQQGCGCAE